MRAIHSSAVSTAAGLIDPIPRVHVRPGHFVVARDPHTLCASLGGALAICLADRCHRVFGLAVLVAQDTTFSCAQPSAAATSAGDVIRWLLNSMVAAGAELPWIGATLVSGDRVSASRTLSVTAICSQVLAALNEQGIELARADIGQHGKQFLSWRVPLGEPQISDTAAIPADANPRVQPHVQQLGPAIGRADAGHATGLTAEARATGQHHTEFA